MSKDNGGPAFPTLFLNGSDGSYFQSTDGGMSLRDYFAAKAMQGFAADPEFSMTIDDLGVIAYSWADAMLKARKA